MSQSTFSGAQTANTNGDKIIKTTAHNAEKLIEKVKELHSYELPECIGIKIEKGSQQYLNWIKESIEK